MTADLQDLFDQAGQHPPPTGALDADVVLRRARRSRNRRTTGAVAATVAVTVALVVAVAGPRRMSTDPAPANPPTVQALGTLGRLAFALDGDIYVADADGRNRVRIADGTPGVDGDCPGYWVEGPIWSPDGQYLAYRGDKNGGETTTSGCSWSRTVNISDAAGHRVASFPSDGWAIAWSPDSTRVAAWSDFYGDPQLEVYGLDGARQALLDMPPGWAPSGDFDPVWSPDGASLLVPGGAQVPVDGSTPTQLPEDDPRSHPEATYSPNGAEIAYSSPDGLVVAATDGSQARVLSPGDLKDFQTWPSPIVWSPTGDRVAFVSRTSGESTKKGRASELIVLDVASGGMVPLADLGSAESFTYFKFSPEGDQILFTRGVATDEPSLWSVHTDGSKPQRLVTGASWGHWQTLTPTR